MAESTPDVDTPKFFRAHGSLRQQDPHAGENGRLGALKDIHVPFGQHQRVPVPIQEHEPSPGNLGRESADACELARFQKTCDKVDEPRTAEAQGLFIVNGLEFQSSEAVGPRAGNPVNCARLGRSSAADATSLEGWAACRRSYPQGPAVPQGNLGICAKVDQERATFTFDEPGSESPGQ